MTIDLVQQSAVDLQTTFLFALVRIHPIITLSSFETSHGKISVSTEP